jgi:hypothetical protein
MAGIRPNERAGLAGLVEVRPPAMTGPRLFTRPTARPVRRHDHRREGQREVSGTAQAKLVAFGVGQDIPASVSLADVDLSRAKGEQPVKLGLLVAVEGFDVQVQPVLGRLRPVRHEPEVDLKRAALSSDRRAIGAAVHNLPAQRCGPELCEQLGVCRVDDQGSDPVFHVLVVAHARSVAKWGAKHPGLRAERVCRSSKAIACLHWLMSVQNVRICTVLVLIGIRPKSAPNGGSVRARCEGLRYGPEPFGAHY